MNAGRARIVLTTFGSLGDLHPFLALGIELKAHGHDVVLVTQPMYRAKVEREGFAFVPAPPDWRDTDEMIAIMRRAMHRTSGSEYVLRELLLPHVRAQYDALSEACAGADLLVASLTALAGPLVAESLRLPWASAVLQPLVLFSAHDPPEFPQFGWLDPLIRRHPALARTVVALGRRKTRPWMKPIDRLRADVGLPASRAHPMFDGMVSPHVHLCMFSGALAEVQPDWPPQSVLTGFAFYDKDDEAACPPEGLAAFLGAGPAPVVFTLGSSAVLDAGTFYEESAKAARRIGRRAVLLIGRDPRNVPRTALPEGVAAFEYAPYSELFPRAAAIVHQGGVGTTAQAMRAGRPMIVVPWSHDQPDHAARITRRGIGETIPRGAYRAARVAAALERVLGDPEMAARADAVGHRIRGENGAARGAEALEALASASKVVEAPAVTIVRNES